MIVTLKKKMSMAAETTRVVIVMMKDHTVAAAFSPKPSKLLPASGGSERLQARQMLDAGCQLGNNNHDYKNNNISDVNSFHTNRNRNI